MTSGIRLERVGRVFPGDPPTVALASVDLDVGPGEYVSIMGPSGSGKSTLLNVLGLLDRPTSGTYRFDGEDVGSMSERQRSAFRGRRIGFVFQSFHLVPSRSVLENVMMARLYSGVPRGARHEAARDAIERVGLGHRVDAVPTSLSGGERQRVAIARALSMRPGMILGDEPTGNLDSTTTGRILDIFDGLSAEGMTMVVITHDADVGRRAQRVVTMADGVIGSAS